MATKIKTPRTMTNDAFLVMVTEQLQGLSASLAVVVDRLEDVLGPVPRPDLRIVSEDPKQGDDA